MSIIMLYPILAASDKFSISPSGQENVSINMCDLLLQTLLWIIESVDSINKDGMDVHMFNVMHCIESNNS